MSFTSLHGRLVCKLDRLEQVQCRWVHLVLVHHPMMRVVHEPRVVARAIKPDRRADRGDGHTPVLAEWGWCMFIVDVLAPPVGGMTIAVTVCARACPCPCRLTLLVPPSLCPEVLLDQNKFLSCFSPFSPDPKSPAKRDEGRGMGSASPTSISKRCWRSRRSGS